MNNGIVTTIKKELRSVFRDKRTLRNIFLIPFIIPIMIFFYGYMYDNLDKDETTYNIGINYELSDYEKESFKTLNINYSVYNTKEELDNAYNDKKITAYIMYDKDNNKYNVYSDESEDGLKTSSVLTTHFDTYNKYLTTKYLIDHDINIEEAYHNFDLENIIIDNSKNYMVQLILSMMIAYVIFSIASATSSMATSITAQERENGTLETLLTFPIKSKDLITGKYLSSVIIGILSSTFGLIIGLVSVTIGKSMFESFKIVTLNINIITILISIIIIILASLFISAVALILTIYSKNTKESQSSTQFLNLICIVPMFLTILSVEITPIYYLIPIFNYNNVLMDIYTESINYQNILLTIVSTIIVIVIALKYIFKTYSSEKVLFRD